MKQIERKDSPQRLICELLVRTPAMTIAEISAARGVHARAVSRQLDSLVAAGFLAASGYPRRYVRTSKPLPPVASRTPKSEIEAARRTRDLQSLQRSMIRPAATDLDRVFAQWRRSGDSHA